MIRVSRLAKAFQPSPLRALLAKCSAPDIISFAIGMPGDDLFPRRELAALAETVLSGGAQGLQYGVPCRSLKQQIVGLMARRGISCDEDRVFLCSGAQQGLRLLCQALVDPGAEVALEEIVYDGILLAARGQAPRVLAVPTGFRDGIDVEALAARLAAGSRPAFLYLIPEGHNPLGSSLGLGKRRRLIELARRYELPLIEDDACGLLSFEESTPCLRSLDAQWVIYVGTLSKVLAPGLRVGWIVAPEHLFGALSRLKQAADFDTSTLAQHLAASFLAGGLFEPHLERLRTEYRRRRDATLEALEEHLGGAASWSCPTAGLYVWLELDPRVDTLEMLDLAIELDRVAYSPGAIYSTHGGARNALRLSFGNGDPDRLREGVARLARAVARWMDQALVKEARS